MPNGSTTWHTLSSSDTIAGFISFVCDNCSKSYDKDELADWFKLDGIYYDTEY